MGARILVMPFPDVSQGGGDGLIDTRYIYDVNGNLTDDGAARTFQWDCFDRLTSVRRRSDNVLLASYVYDTGNRRVRTYSRVTDSDGNESMETVETSFDGWRGVAEYVDGASAPTREFVFGAFIDEPLSIDCDCDSDGSPERYYYLQNNLYSVVGLTGEDAALVEAYIYDPYGRHARIAGPGDDEEWFTSDDSIYAMDDASGLGLSACGTPCYFTGRYYDIATGLYNYRNRYYDVQLGRFVSRDPIKYLDGNNIYAYVRNSPLRSIDPFGLFWIWGDDWMVFNGGEPYGVNTSIEVSKKVNSDSFDADISGVLVLAYADLYEFVSDTRTIAPPPEQYACECDCGVKTSLFGGGPQEGYAMVTRRKIAAKMYGVYTEVGVEGGFSKPGSLKELLELFIDILEGDVDPFPSGKKALGVGWTNKNTNGKWVTDCWCANNRPDRFEKGFSNPVKYLTAVDDVYERWGMPKEADIRDYVPKEDTYEWNYVNAIKIMGVLNKIKK